MKRRNVVAGLALSAGGYFFCIGVEKGLQNVGHEVSITVDQWGNKSYVEPAELKAKGNQLTHQTYLYFGAMAISFATAAQQIIKQSNLETAQKTGTIAEDLIVIRLAAEQATVSLAASNHALAMALNELPETYPPIPELPAYLPAVDEPNIAKILPFVLRSHPTHHPDYEGVA